MATSPLQLHYKIASIFAVTQFFIYLKKKKIDSPKDESFEFDTIGHFIFYFFAAQYQKNKKKQTNKQTNNKN